MRSKVFAALVLVVACVLSLLVADCRAQQVARRGYYSRVQTEAGVSAATTGGARYGSRASYGRVASYRDPYQGSDPLRPYGSDAGSGFKPRPYERTPVISAPERPAPAPVARHNYYPGLRSGQGPNHNQAVAGRGGHCFPGRGAFLHR